MIFLNQLARRTRKWFFLIITATGVSLPVFAQPTAFVDDFNQGLSSSWHWDSVTFELEVQDSVLVVHYHRTASSWEWHNFHIIFPEPVNVTPVPKISLRVRSTLATVLTLKPVYANGGSDWLQRNVPGDNEWHLYRFNLERYAGTLLERIYFYLDGGTTEPRSGTVWFDDLLVGEEAVLPAVSGLTVVSQSPARIELRWSCDLPARTQFYRVYRGEVSGFPANPAYMLDTCAALAYTDTAVAANHLYFYRVAAVDTSGREGPLSQEVGAHTYAGGLLPSVSVKAVNRQSVGLYEKFEVLAGLQNAIYTNPYDPEQIDLSGEFTAPSGKVWHVPGFYDNFQGKNEWKVRFAPNETGEWTFRLVLKNGGQTVYSASRSFTAVPSAYHGWIRPSPQNPHYLIYDDGTPFYGVGAYYPWSVSNGSSGLARLQEAGANIFGYWNIMYGNEGRIIESLVSGIGHYDQAKCGRIDQILEWSESRNLKVMLAIWPHDLLSSTVWVHQWQNNPYKDVCDVNDFYSSEAAWRYQKKQYRYLIARWGYSRSLAVWEIVNEINGTDGWVNGRQQEATQWVDKVHRFFKEMDPFGHPTTASQSGGLYWAEGYNLVDLPNVHLYETGWPMAFPGDPLRSSAHLYHRIAAQLYRDFAKPGIFGEAGYRNTYGSFAVPSPEYTTLYHNALWASWAGGLAMTPFWWAYNSPDIMSDDVLEQMRSFAAVAGAHPYAREPLQPGDLWAEECDAYAMRTDSSAFGWIRQRQGKNLSAYPFRLKGLADTVYAVTWYNTWDGNPILTTFHRSEGGVLSGYLPDFGAKLPDAAFFAEMAATGVTPAGIRLNAYPASLLALPDEESTVSAVVVDSLGRLCSTAAVPVTFLLQGPGVLVGDVVQTTRGGQAAIRYRPDTLSGSAQIIAQAPGLQPDTVTIQVRDHLLIDDFEDYLSDAALQAVWKVRGGTKTEIYLETQTPIQGEHSLRMTYAIGNGNPPYAGVSRALISPRAEARALRLRLLPDGSNRLFSVLLFEKNGRYWRRDVPLAGTDTLILELPFRSFQPSSPADTIAWFDVDELGLLIFQGNGAFGQGSLLIDDLQLVYAGGSTGVRESSLSLPQRFRLYGSYPNPFNQATGIRFELPRRTPLRVEVFNVRGRRVAVLWSGMMPAGKRQLLWRPEGRSSGVYFYRIHGPGIYAAGKMLLLR